MRIRFWAGWVGMICGGFMASVAGAQEFKWRMATIAPNNSVYNMFFSLPFAELAGKLTNNRVKIDVFEGGVLTPIFKIYDAVGDGLIEVGHVPPAFLGTKDPTNAMIGGFPTGLGVDSFASWLYMGGGHDLWVRHRRETMDMHPLIVGYGPSEIFAHSHVPVSKVEDLKGLKFRTLGNWAAILKDSFGASPTVVPFAELYGMLEKKSIDIMEYSTPSENSQQGYQEIAKYIIYPGIHAPSWGFEVVMKKDRWDRLPADIKANLELAAKLTTHESIMKFIQRDFDGMEKLRGGKNEWIRLDKTFEEKARAASRKWATEEAAKAKAAGNPWPERVAQSIFTFQDRWRKYSDYMVVDRP
jgi:TRAP-type mannitol/chloroaromatic compound transport system substrate-binding protein